VVLELDCGSVTITIVVLEPGWKFVMVVHEGGNKMIEIILILMILITLTLPLLAKPDYERRVSPGERRAQHRRSIFLR